MFLGCGLVGSYSLVPLGSQCIRHSIYNILLALLVVVEIIGLRLERSEIMHSKVSDHGCLIILLRQGMPQVYIEWPLNSNKIR